MSNKRKTALKKTLVIVTCTSAIAAFAINSSFAFPLLKQNNILLENSLGSASSRPFSVAAKKRVNGYNVAKVYFNGGNFRKLGGKRWTESGEFSFVETGRDQWSVYLHDAGRGVNIQLDLHTETIYYSDSSTSRRPLYKISWSVSSTGKKDDYAQIRQQQTNSSSNNNNSNNRNSNVGNNSGQNENCIKIGLLKICN